ncbi:MAG: hypothetical protein ACM30E_07270 [Nitrososphaerales archaeon]
MERRTLANPTFVTAVLILQFIPLILFPASSFSSTTQEWWLPVLLVIMSLVAVFALIVRHTPARWPWDLLSFAQGFNIISRLMMIWPHSANQVGTTWVVDVPYVTLSLLSIVLSALALWYMEKPDVRTALLRA